MRIGIFGGSFNPVHRGHLKLAREALSELNLNHVFFVPARVAPLKTASDLLPDELRVNLLRSALSGEPGFSVSECEIRREGLSFTVDTLRFFKKRGGKTDVLYFLAGGDVLKDFGRWKSPAEVLRLCRFTVMTRPGYAPSALPDGVLWQPFDALPISSTAIRQRLRRGLSVSHLVPRGTEKALTGFYKKRKGDFRSN